ncbi:CGNR zinc finger domain-containing protein [Kribbella sp. NPDC056861]|uniref:CGNR zinc finger domain-containing protein n=1 Tax=Kribbella sp. NPDC056861 TaxID=3154857 RepID=UPI003433C9A2
MRGGWVGSTRRRGGEGARERGSEGARGQCEDPTCTLLFVDSSRSHRRRWCSMDRCGARSKMRTLRSAQ